MCIRSWKRAPEPPESQTAVSHHVGAGLEPKSSARTANVLDYSFSPAPPAPMYYFFFFLIFDVLFFVCLLNFCCELLISLMI